MNYHLPLIKLGQKRSGELRGFSKTRQNPRELGVFSGRQNLVLTQGATESVCVADC